MQVFKIVIISLLILVSVNCFFFDTISVYKLEGSSVYNYLGECGRFEMNMRSALKLNTFKLRIEFQTSVDTLFPKKLKIEHYSEGNLNYEIWTIKDQLLKDTLYQDVNFLDYFFETDDIHKVFIWSDKIGVKNQLNCQIDTLRID